MDLLQDCLTAAFTSTWIYYPCFAISISNVTTSGMCSFCWICGFLRCVYNFCAFIFCSSDKKTRSSREVRWREGCRTEVHSRLLLSTCVILGGIMLKAKENDEVGRRFVMSARFNAK